MATRRKFLSLFLAAITLVIAGCGGGSTLNVENSPAPESTKVSIAFQTTPAETIEIGQSLDVAAVVSNDDSKSGVDWTVSCQQGSDCGSLSSFHTSSGQPTTYTPPSTISGDTEGVNIVAFATADHAQNAAASITVKTVKAPPGKLKGQYVLQAQGVDFVSLLPYQFAGVVVLDGNGVVTSGEQTVNIYDQNVGSLLSKSDPITGGSYLIGPDGRGTLTLNTDDPQVGLGGTETFSFVVLSNSEALIAQTDGTAATSGTMDLQTSVAPLTGGYAFVMNGTDVGTFLPTAFGGVFNVDSPNTISGNGSLADQNLNGTVTLQQPLSGTVSNPDPFGAVTIDLNIDFAFVPVQFIGFIVDATHIKLIETDNASGAGFGSTGGLAIGQGSATGTFTNAALSGTYVFGVPGVDLTENFIGTAPATFTSVGVFTADGGGNLQDGFTDTFLQANCIQEACFANGTPGAQISGGFTGTYTVDTSGAVQANFNSFSPAPTPDYSPSFVFYLTGNGTPALVLDLGDTLINNDTGFPSYPSVGAGIAYPQSADSLTFSGEYGLSLTQQNFGEIDATGQMTADAASNTLSGVIDTSSGAFNALLNGSFAALGPDGRFSGTLGGDAFPVPFTTEFYAIDSGHGFFVESDLHDPNNPGVVALGYYAVRTAVTR